MKTTTQRIKELYEKAKGKEFKFTEESDDEACDFFVFTSMKNTNAACMAVLLERAYSLLRHEEDCKVEVSHWIEDFNKFQRGE